jgi:AraC family transcriptional regulator, melibiose operon regulatory protein
MAVPEDIQSPIGFRVWSGTCRPMQHAHRHNDIELNLVERGAMTYLHGGRICSVRKGELGVIWGAIPHQLIKIDAPVHCHWVTLPLAWFLQWKLPESLAHPVLHGELPVHTDPDALDFSVFGRWAREMKSDPAEARKIVLLEIEARLRRMALQMTRPGENGSSRKLKAAVPSGGFGKVEQMAQFVAANYTKEMRVSDIAEHAGLHPNYGMSLFRRTFGVSLMDYLMQHRISHAQRLLATTDAKILDVALDSGFGSVSRFYAAFSSVCRQSPKQYRASMRIS